jgi:glycosyltransferase involved in cell wall biosynthesis
LIIVNDCSTDSTEQLILSYTDSRIKYIKNVTNQRLPKSLNIGFSHASGTYYTWTSDDNFFDINAIAKMVDALESQNVDLVCAPYFTVDNSEVVTGERTVGKQCNVLIDNVVKACFLYRDEIHHKLKGYNPALFLVEDYDFWIRAVFENFQFYQLPEKLYYYRFHENSLTETRRNDISKALYQLLKSHEILFSKTNKDEFLKAAFYLKLSYLALANNESAFKFYKIALSKNALLVFNKVTLKFLLRLIKFK